MTLPLPKCIKAHKASVWPQLVWPPKSRLAHGDQHHVQYNGA